MHLSLLLRTCTETTKQQVFNMQKKKVFGAGEVNCMANIAF